MKREKDYVKSILGVDVRARSRNDVEPDFDSFSKPIIHKQINGSKVYVPLDVERLWGR